MELLSPTDLLFLKIAVSGCALALTRLSLSRILSPSPTPHTPSFPLIQQSKGKRRVGPPPTRSIKKQLEQTGKRGIIFYGTQTGTAERLSSRLAKEAATRYDLNCLVADSDDYDYADLQTLASAQPVFFLLATYGEGEPTDNAISLKQHLLGLSGKEIDLSNLTYAAFGLGSSSYQSYNAMSRDVDQVVLDAGAQRAGALGLGDDGKGTMDEDLTIWSQRTLADIAARYGMKELAYQYSPSFNIVESNLRKGPVFRGDQIGPSSVAEFANHTPRRILYRPRSQKRESCIAQAEIVSISNLIRLAQQSNMRLETTLQSGRPIQTSKLLDSSGSSTCNMQTRQYQLPAKIPMTRFPCHHQRHMTQWHAIISTSVLLYPVTSYDNSPTLQTVPRSRKVLLHSVTTMKHSHCR